MYDYITYIVIYTYIDVYIYIYIHISLDPAILLHIFRHCIRHHASLPGPRAVHPATHARVAGTGPVVVDGWSTRHGVSQEKRKM